MRIFISFLFFINFVFSQDLYNKFDDIFPKVKEEKIRQILKLEKDKNEDKLFIKFKFGKNAEVDCNHHLIFGLSLQEEVLNGYNYFIISGKSELGSTKMACLDDKKIVKFVAFDPNLILKYNSKVPFIFYTPEDISVKYEIYRLEKEQILTK